MLFMKLTPFLALENSFATERIETTSSLVPRISEMTLLNWRQSSASNCAAFSIICEAVLLEPDETELEVTSVLSNGYNISFQLEHVV